MLCWLKKVHQFMIFFGPWILIKIYDVALVVKSLETPVLYKGFDIFLLSLENNIEYDKHFQHSQSYFQDDFGVPKLSAMTNGTPYTLQLSKKKKRNQMDPMPMISSYWESQLSIKFFFSLPCNISYIDIVV